MSMHQLIALISILSQNFILTPSPGTEPSIYSPALGTTVNNSPSPFCFNVSFFRRYALQPFHSYQWLLPHPKFSSQISMCCSVISLFPLRFFRSFPFHYFFFAQPIKMNRKKKVLTFIKWNELNLHFIVPRNHVSIYTECA